LWQSPTGSGIALTEYPSHFSNSLGSPAGTFRRPSLSSLKAISSASYPCTRHASATARLRSASPRLPMWGNPDAPNPLSVLISLRLRPSFFSRSISSAAALSYHVPFPIICESRPVDAITYPSYHKFGATLSLKFTEIWIEFFPKH
jgi:hypothetical protein